MGKTVLVTGVSMDLGRRFARQLAEQPGIDRVIGVDVLPPQGHIGNMQFVRADIRNPVIAKVIARESVDTVVHMGVIASPGNAGGRASMKESNVIGTMQLLAACQQAESVRRLVVKSSTSFYGSSNRDPAMFTEQMGARRVITGGYGKDIAEVEGYVRGFMRRRPDVRVVILRAANVVGRDLHSPMMSYFRLPVIPTVLGFDARLQLLHEYDLLGVLRHAVLTEPQGIFNVAGDGIMMLSQAVRRLGRPTVKVPTFALASVGSVIRRARMADFTPEQVDFLTYGRGVDTTKMRTEFGFTPAYTTQEAFADLADSLKPGLLRASRVEAAEQLLLGTFSAGQRAKQLPSGGASSHGAATSVGGRRG